MSKREGGMKFQPDALQRKILGERAKAGKPTPPRPKRTKTTGRGDRATRMIMDEWGKYLWDDDVKRIAWDMTFAQEYTPAEEKPAKSEADEWLEKYMEEEK